MAVTDAHMASHDDENRVLSSGGGGGGGQRMPLQPTTPANQPAMEHSGLGDIGAWFRPPRGHVDTWLCASRVQRAPRPIRLHSAIATYHALLGRDSVVAALTPSPAPRTSHTFAGGQAACCGTRLPLLLTLPLL